MGRLYGRKCNVIVADSNGFGVELSKLRCIFSIEKSMTETPNYSEVTIYNLSAENENAIITTGQRVIIEAGYEEGRYGLIFSGDIVQPLREREGGIDYKLTLVAQDGDVFLNNSIISTSFSAGQTLQEIAGQIAESSSNSAEIGNISDVYSQKTLARGKAVFGMPRTYLRKLSHSEDAAFYINDNKINLVKASDIPEGEVVNLSPSTGLIGVPEQTEQGIKGKCLLNPQINLNGLIYIDSSLLKQMKASTGSCPHQLDSSGVYRIISVTHTGDTRGNEWYTSFTAISQAGNVPDLGDSLY